MSFLAHETDGLVRHGTLWRPVAARAGSLGAWLRRAWRDHRAARAMRGLSPEMLKDIGVSFAEIDTVVRHGRPSRRQGPGGGSRP